MSDADLIKAAIGRVRKRQFLFLWLNSSVIALLAFILWAILCSLRFIALPVSSPGFHLALMVLMLSAALAVSIRTMPSWKESVKQIDETLGLQQRLQTSWENIPPRDEIDSLLLADAAKRIVRLRPALIIPMRLNRIAILSFFILLPAVACLGILRVFLDWHQNNTRIQENITIQTASGSRPPKKNSSKMQDKNRSSNLKTQSYLATDGDPEGRQPAKSESPRQPAGIPGQFGIHETLKPNANSAPDSGVAERNENPAKPSHLAPGMADAEKKDPRQPVQPVAVKQEKKIGSGNASVQSSISQHNAGVVHTRNIGKEGGAPTSAHLNSGIKEVGNALAAGQGKSSLAKKDAVFQNKYIKNNPAVWTAVEQAVSKEMIPPGMKRYIMDYFNLIHP
jgi:hypothetical protein